MTSIREYIESHKRGTRALFIALVVLFAVALVGSFFIGIVWSFKIVFASILLLWLPGFFITLIFFPHHDRIIGMEEQPNGRSLDMIERATMAMLLSIVISSVLVYTLHLTTIFFLHAQVSKLTSRNLSVVLMGFSMLSGAWALWRQKILSPIYAIPVAMFPLALYGLNRLVGAAFTTRNLIVEGFGLIVVLVLVFVVTKFKKQRPLM